jgi:hypothetical protein
METWETILEILSVCLLIVAIIYRKKPWGQKLLYFSLGMIIAFLLTIVAEEAIKGWNEGVSNRIAH